MSPQADNAPHFEMNHGLFRITAQEHGSKLSEMGYMTNEHHIFIAYLQSLVPDLRVVLRSESVSFDHAFCRLKLRRQNGGGFMRPCFSTVVYLSCFQIEPGKVGCYFPRVRNALRAQSPHRINFGWLCFCVLQKV